jgi:hypothetical protein
MTYSPAILQPPQARHMSRSSLAAACRIASDSFASGPGIIKRTGAAPSRRRANPMPYFRHQSGPRFSRDPSTNNATINVSALINGIPKSYRPRSCANCTVPYRAKFVTKLSRVSGGLSQHIYGPLSLTIAINHTTPTAQASGAATQRISAARSNMERSHG